MGWILIVILSGVPFGIDDTWRVSVTHIEPFTSQQQCIQYFEDEVKEKDQPFSKFVIGAQCVPVQLNKSE